VPTPIPLASPAPVASPSTDVTAAIKQVIQQANHEQEQAFASNDPTVMQDTATSDYYSQLVQDLQALAADGVTAIHLVHLDWGQISLQGASHAQATTSETWNAVLFDHSTQQETDTNVYTLVLQDGGWKIQADQHPDTRELQTPGGTSGTPAATAAPGPIPSPAPGSSPSVNWAGYSASGGTFTAVSATWTIPTVGTSTDPAADATWVGIGGVSSTDLIQAGTDAIVENGQVSYAAWIETLPQAAQNVPLTVSPGDQVNVAITEQSSGTWQIVIKDVTTSKSYQTTVQYQSTRSSAEWIEESPSAGRRLLLPLDDFGSIPFSAASAVVDGHQRTIAQANGEPITMEVSRGQELAIPSVLDADGAGFTVTRTDVPAPRMSPGGRRFRGTGSVLSALSPS
jgi:hypothetical protein